jgi:hypothetical protein
LAGRIRRLRLRVRSGRGLRLKVLLFLHGRVLRVVLCLLGEGRRGERRTKGNQAQPRLAMGGLHGCLLLCGRFGVNARKSAHGSTLDVRV